MDSPASHFNFLFLQNRQASPRFNTLVVLLPLLMFPALVADELLMIFPVDAVAILLKLDPDPV